MTVYWRIAVMLTPVLVWGLLYAVSRLGNIEPKRFLPRLQFGFVLLLGASVLLFAFDHPHLSNVLAIHAWGMYGAAAWIRHHLREEDPQPVITSIKL